MNRYGITTKTERCALPHGAFEAEIYQLDDVKLLRLTAEEVIKSCIGQLCDVHPDKIQITEEQVLQICKTLQPLLSDISCDGRTDCLKIIYPNIQNRTYHKRLK